MIFQNDGYHESGFLNSANNTISNFYNSIQQANDYLHLKAVNDSLANEIARLKGQQNTAFIIDSTTLITHFDTIPKRQYTYTWAKVINATTQFRNNYLTINKGKLHGIKPRMAVINENGVVGVIKDVTNNYATIISLLNKKTRISARLTRTNAIGYLTWDGGNYYNATLNDIPTHIKVLPGDTIVSSTYSDIYPDNIPVGIVTKIETPEGASLQKITLRLAVDMKRLGYVYIITDQYKSQKDSLEAKLNYD